MGWALPTSASVFIATCWWYSSGASAKADPVRFRGRRATGLLLLQDLFAGEVCPDSSVRSVEKERVAPSRAGGKGQPKKSGATSLPTPPRALSGSLRAPHWWVSETRPAGEGLKPRSGSSENEYSLPLHIALCLRADPDLKAVLRALHPDRQPAFDGGQDRGR
jgi:hypothetical protein